MSIPGPKAKVLIPMADYGNDPTETATPFALFLAAGFSITIATETAAIPRCDDRMLSGLTGTLLGAPRVAIERHTAMLATQEYQHPIAWSAPDFNILDYDLVFLPGGHDKGMRQYITSASLHAQLARFMPRTARGTAHGAGHGTGQAQAQEKGSKVCGAVCHGVQVLAAADDGTGKGKSVIHDFETTSLTSVMENTAFWGTRLFLGDYYKTFGAGTDNVEVAVRKRLDRPEVQYKSSLSSSPFVHEDPRYNYLSGRFPGDAELLAKETIRLVKSVVGGA